MLSLGTYKINQPVIEEKLIDIAKRSVNKSGIRNTGIRGYLVLKQKKPNLVASYFYYQPPVKQNRVLLITNISTLE